MMGATQDIPLITGEPLTKNRNLKGDRVSNEYQLGEKVEEKNGTRTISW